MIIDRRVILAVLRRRHAKEASRSNANAISDLTLSDFHITQNNIMQPVTVIDLYLL